jgi:tetratricopeptide (TPR) repeat protein
MLPSEGMPYAGMARVSAKQYNFPGAIEYYGKAMGCDPLNIEFLLDMGKAYEATQENASALATYEEALKSNPKKMEIYCRMVGILRKQRNFERAVGLVSAGLGIDPDYPELHFLLGDIRRLQEKPLDAITEYEIAAKKGGKEYNDAYRQIGLLYFYKIVDYAEAEKALHKYERAGGKDKEVEEILDKISKQ